MTKLIANSYPVLKRLFSIQQKKTINLDRERTKQMNFWTVIQKKDNFAGSDIPNINNKCECECTTNVCWMLFIELFLKKIKRERKSKTKKPESQQF